MTNLPVLGAPNEVVPVEEPNRPPDWEVVVAPNSPPPPWAWVVWPNPPGLNPEDPEKIKSKNMKNNCL